MKVGDTVFEEGFKNGANSGNDYAYDFNGNLVMDKNKEIADIYYNYLNLPGYIEFVSPYIEKDRIYYNYSAEGIKQQKRVVTDNSSNIQTTDYAGNFIYEDGELRMFFQPEGYVQPKDPGDYSQGFEYVYQYKDHINNVRLSYSDLDGNGSIDPQNEILQERNYYPFGLVHEGYNNVINGTENNYKTFQDQEISKELGYNMLEFRWRHYDPAIARFVAVDPLAEDFYHNGVYNFSENRVIDGFELEGLERVDFRDKEVKSMQDYFNRNAKNYNTGASYDDCITCHNKGMRTLLNDNSVPVGSQADITRSRMQSAGYAGDTHRIGFNDSNGNKAITPKDVSVMDGSVAETASNLTGNSENSVFGVSLVDGYHTMTLTVSNTEVSIPSVSSDLEGSESQTITVTTYTLSDQGTGSGTDSQGNLTFNSGQALDQHLTNYVQGTSQSRTAQDFPAQIEIHQIQEPE